jgi:hypothetical protein
MTDSATAPVLEYGPPSHWETPLYIIDTAMYIAVDRYQRNHGGANMPPHVWRHVRRSLNHPAHFSGFRSGPGRNGLLVVGEDGSIGLSPLFHDW